MNHWSALFESLFDSPVLDKQYYGEGKDILLTSESPSSLLEEGDNLWTESKSKAFERYIQAIKLSQFTGSWTEENGIYYRLVERLLEEKSYSEIIKLVDFAFLRAKAAEDWNEAAQFVLWGTWMRFREKRKLEVTYILKEAVGFLDKVNDLEKALQVLETYIDISFIMGNMQETLKFNEQYLSLIRQLNRLEKELHHLTDRQVPCLIALGKHEEARESAFRAIHLAEQQNNFQMQVKSLNLLCSVEIALGNHESALICSNQALAVAQSNKSDGLILECLAESAQARNSMGLAYEGAQIAAEGLRISIQQENHSFISRFMSLLKNNGEMKESVWSDFKQLSARALEAVRASGKLDDLTSCLSSLGDLSLKRDPEAALAYFQELEAIYEADENILQVVETNRSIARAYQNIGLLVGAAAALEKALIYFYRNDFRNDWLLVALLLETSKVYLQMENLDESKKQLHLIKKHIGEERLEMMSWALTYILSLYEGNLFLAQKDYYSAELAYWKSLSLLNTQFYMAASGDIRLSILDAVRKLTNDLITACLRQSNTETITPSVQLRMFHYVEFSRSRFLLTQLGHTSILPPVTIPLSHLEAENRVIRKLQQFSTMFQNNDDTSVISEQLETWRKLQALWSELEIIDFSAQKYVSIRRGDVLSFNAIKVCLEE